MMTIKYPSSDGLAADLAYEKEGVQKSINMDQHRVDVLKRIDPNKLQWKKQKTETFNQSAWHGSPHDFVEFLLSAIGTGEGAQAHGWGLYFAKNRRTSEGYKKRLAKITQEYYAYDGKEHKEYDYKDPIFQAMSLFQKSRV